MGRRWNRRTGTGNFLILTLFYAPIRRKKAGFKDILGNGEEPSGSAGFRAEVRRGGETRKTGLVHPLMAAGAKG